MKEKVAWIVPVSAGFIAVLVGFSSSIAIVLQATHAAGTTPAQASSWVLALCLAMGVTSIGLSWWMKMPVLTAWSTPGAALLVTSLPGVPLAEAIGAFLVSGSMVTLVGLTGVFEKWITRIPASIAAAMLAGVLLRFGMDIAVAATLSPGLVLAMALVFFLGKRWLARYAVPATLMAGIGLALLLGLVDTSQYRWALAIPQWTAPAFAWTSIVGVAIPLFVVTMASQNLPGLAVLRASGYTPQVSSIITATGLTSMATAPFGGFGVNLAAITAALCASNEGHPDPAQRYKASMAAGVFYVAAGLLGVGVVALFAAVPKALVMTIAGLALLGTIATALNTAMGSLEQRDAALITFLVSASPVSFFGVGAAFWGLVAGLIVLVLGQIGSVRSK